MHRYTLTAWLRQPQVKHMLLHGFRGPCTLSAMTHPQRAEEVAIRIRVPRDAEVQAVPSVLVDGETVEVFLEHSYLPLRSHLCS